MPLPSSVRSSLRRASRWLALAILAGSVIFWIAKGSHRGWSQDRVPIPQLDEITGIEYVIYEERFVPGIDWLAGGIGAAVVVFAASFFIRSKPQPPTA